MSKCHLDIWNLTKSEVLKTGEEKLHKYRKVAEDADEDLSNYFLLFDS